MHKALLVQLLLLVAFSSATLTLGKDGRLDPGPITWPKNTWVISPVVFNRANAGSSSTITINYRLTTPFTGTVYFEFPSSFAPTTADTSASAQYSAETDASPFVLTSVALPNSAGAYGPFKIWTRSSVNGQIIDRSYNFASVYVTQQITATSPITITTDSTSATKVKSEIPIYFQFNIDFDIWSNDVFVIQVPSQWKPPQKPVCQSIDITDVPNVFKSTNMITGESGSALNCITDGSNILVYGLNQDIDISQANQPNSTVDLKLKISNFTAPSGIYTTFTWDIEVLRARTYNVIKKYQATNKPELTNGTITINSWASTNGYPNTFMKQNIPVYMTTSFITENPIPHNGTIVVTFTDVQSSTAPHGCYMIHSYASCSITTNTVTITISNSADTDNDGVADGVEPGLFTFYSLNTFDTSTTTAQITSIISYVSTGEVIDKTAAAHTLTMGDQTNVTKMTTFSFFGASNTASNGSGGADDDNTAESGVTAWFQAQVKPSGSNFTANSITLRFPYNKTGRDYLTYYFPSGTLKGKIVKNTSATVPSVSSYDTSVSNTIANEVSITSQSLDLTTDVYISVGFANVDSGNNAIVDSNDFVTPYVASNIATRYESWLIISNGTSYYVHNHQFVITASSYNNLSVTSICGNVIRVTLSAKSNFNLSTSGKSFYLSYNNSASMTAANTGVAYDTQYPAYKVNYSPTLKLGQSNNLYSDDILSLSTSTTYEFFTSIPFTTQATFSTIQYYFIDSTQRSNVNFVIFSSTNSQGAAVSHTNENLATSPTNVAVSSSGSTISSVSTTNINASSNYISVQVPKGFSITSSSVTVDTVAVPLNKIQDDNNKFFAFPSAVTAAVTTSASASSLQIQAKAYWATSNNLGGFKYGKTGTCFQNDQNLNSTKATFISTVGQPTTCIKRGPDTHSTNVTISFNTNNGIYDNGQIVAVLGGAWEVISGVSTCSTSASRKVQTPVVLNSQTCTINQLNAANSGTYTITFNNVLPPDGTTTSDHWVTIQNQTSDGNIIDDATGLNKSLCGSPSNATSVGKSTINSSSTLIPSNAGYTAADIYLNFSLGKTTPSGSTLKITSPTVSWVLQGSSIQNQIYFTKLYSQVSVTGNDLTITLSEQITAGEQQELYIEGALTYPDTATKTGKFMIETEYAGVTINQDTSDSPGTNTELSLTTKIDGTITGGTTPVSTNNSVALARNAEWTFSFSTSVAIAVGDQIWIQFPKTFDPDLGGAEIRYSEEPTTFYIPCFSARLGTGIECIIDHNYLKVINLSANEANISKSITVYNITNPEPLTSTGDFKIFLVSGWSAKAIGTLAGIAISSFPANITVKKASSADFRLFGLGDYRFEFYLAANVSADQVIVLTLPREFDTGLSRNENAIDCSLSQINHANDSTSLDELSIKISSCAVNDNRITFVGPSEGISVSQNIRLIYTLTSMSNPEWGKQRSSLPNQNWNFDTFDNIAYPTYTRWTDQFQLSVYDTVTHADIAKSYYNVNGAYLGFTTRTRQLIVNNYNSMMMSDRIIVNPGTQTEPISIKFQDNEFLAAKRIILTPKINEHTSDSGKLLLTSVHDDFRIVYEEKDIKFKVAAAIDLTQGLYWIDWTVSETKAASGTDSQYDPPVKTLIEVTDGSSKAILTAENLPTVGIGNKSRPVCVSTKHAPHSDLNVNISLADSDVTGVTFLPNTLKFKPDVNKRCFQIQVDSEFSVDISGSELQVKFTLEGTDVSAYSTLSNKTLNISSITVVTAGNVSQCKALSPGTNSATVTAQASASGILYVAVQAKGSVVDSQSTIAEALGDIFYLESDPSFSDVEKSGYEPSDEDINNTDLEPWTSFQRNLTAACLSLRVFNAVSIKENEPSEVIDLEELCSNLSYQSSCYIVNSSDKSSEVLTESWTTSATAPPILFSVTFVGNISQTYQNKIRDTCARRLGINEYRLLNGTRTQARRLQNSGNTISSTTFSWVIGQSRTVGSPTPSEIANFNSDVDNEAALKSELRAVVAEYGNTNPITLKTETVTVPTTPQWVTGFVPQSSGSPTTSSITASMQCNVQGQICGICEKSSEVSNNITHDQILNGFDSNNVETSGSNCVEYAPEDQSITLTMSSLSAGTSYKCSFQCFNTYPVFPGYIVYTQDVPIDSFTATTASNAESDGEDDDFSQYHALSIMLMILMIAF